MAVLRQLAEESAELAQASLKAIREDYSEESLAHIIEELADVQVMMIQIECLTDINYDSILKIMIEKTDRQIERIKAEGGKLPI